MDVWMTILLAIGGNTALLAVLAWLAKSLIGGWMTQDLDRHREQLKRETEAALTTMRHELGMVAQEHALKASELQTRRAAVIAEIYGLLADVEWEASMYVSLADLTGQNKNEEQHAKVTGKVEQFYRYFNRNRIYLPEDTCDTVWSVMNGMVQATNQMKSYLYDVKDGGWVGKQQIEALQAAHVHFDRKHRDARKKLERDLRTIMGDGGQEG